MVFSFIADLWRKWNIRGLVILSLSLQVILLLFAPLRAKTANDRIVSFLWSAFLVADWVAPSAIGLIQGNSQAHVAEIDESLQAFWASFLLLHLGGPDTITTFSMDDSVRWRQNPPSLISQVIATVYIFVHVYSKDKSLVIPTMLVLLAGVIKIAERIVAINLSSLPRLRMLMLSKLEYFSDESNCRVERLVDMDLTTYSDKKVQLPENIVVKHAYFFFQILKVFIGDPMLTPSERKMSCKYFHRVSALDALRVISVELQFLYEVLHTKVLAMRSMWSFIFRFIAFTNVATALVLFNQLKKHQLPKLDVKITYSLLSGAIAVDVIALLMLIFSDWTVAKIMSRRRRSSNLYSLLYKLVFATSNLRKLRFNSCEAVPNTNLQYEVLDTSFIFRRWSESISACNLISERLKESPRKMYKHPRCNGFKHPICNGFSNFCSFPFHMAKKIISCFNQVGEAIVGSCGVSNTKWMIAKMKYVSKNPFIKELWIFIFEEVKRKSKSADDQTAVREISEARDDSFLKNRQWEIDFSDFLVDVTEATYDDSIIIWHLATEIWYNNEKKLMRNDKREFSKILSDYMLYLLLNQPHLVPAVAVAGIAQIRSAKVLCQLQMLINDATNDVEGLCNALLKVPLDLWGGNIQYSPLDKGFRLVKVMEKLGDMKWELMSRVWVEKLSYAATHVKGEAHVEILSKGGELLAFVWLLMAHFGCFYKPA